MLPSIPLLGIYPKGLKAETQTDICTSMFIATLLTIAKRGKATQVSTDGWTDRQNVVCKYNGISFGL